MVFGRKLQPAVRGRGRGTFTALLPLVGLMLLLLTCSVPLDAVVFAASTSSGTPPAPPTDAARTAADVLEARLEAAGAASGSATSFSTSRPEPTEGKEEIASQRAGISKSRPSALQQQSPSDGPVATPSAAAPLRRQSKRIPPAVPVKIWDLEHEAFDRIVRDPERHVFVKFYTPWCKHCADMELQFRRLAELMPHVTFGQVNGEVDTDPMHKYKVKELPVLMLFTKDDKSGMKYVGARDVRSMKAFVQTMIEEI